MSIILCEHTSQVDWIKPNNQILAYLDYATAMRSPKHTWFMKLTDNERLFKLQIMCFTEQKVHHKVIELIPLGSLAVTHHHCPTLSNIVFCHLLLLTHQCSLDLFFCPVCKMVDCHWVCQIFSFVPHLNKLSVGIENTEAHPIFMGARMKAAVLLDKFIILWISCMSIK